MKSKKKTFLVCCLKYGEKLWSQGRERHKTILKIFKWFESWEGNVVKEPSVRGNKKKIRKKKSKIRKTNLENFLEISHGLRLKGWVALLV